MPEHRPKLKTLFDIFKKKKEVEPAGPTPGETNFCYFPFFQVIMTADGKYKPCSKYSEYITHEGNVLEVGQANVKEAWNSDYMKNLRSTIKNNGKGAGCGECWREQAAGIKPMRYDSYGYNVPRMQVHDPARPMRIEINASNVCNLKCRICSSWASTKWTAEEKTIYGRAEEKHINLTMDNLQEIKSWLPQITEIGLFGGEPFLSDENLALLKYCIESGEAQHIDVLVNTNTTVYTDEIVEILKGFKKVYLNFSIDDIGKRFEYQRKGAEWDSVVENMKKYISHGGYGVEDKIQCKICCTVTNMNIYYFPEYFAYMNEHFPGLPVFMNLLYDPWQYSVQILPTDIKDIIRERLRTQVKISYTAHELLTKNAEVLITYLDDEDTRDFADFFKLIKKHDVYRKESFAEIFPEYWGLIQKYSIKDTVLR